MKLAAAKMSVASLSGNMSKDQRKVTLTRFRNGEFRALIVSGLCLPKHCLYKGHANAPQYACAILTVLPRRQEGPAELLLHVHRCVIRL